jgi:hypothetical protein
MLALERPRAHGRHRHGGAPKALDLVGERKPAGEAMPVPAITAVMRCCSSARLAAGWPSISNGADIAPCVPTGAASTSCIEVGAVVAAEIWAHRRTEYDALHAQISGHAAHVHDEIWHFWRIRTVVIAGTARR